jgi:hypothetical protein
MKHKYLTNKEVLNSVLNFMADKASKTGLPREHFEKVSSYYVGFKNYSEEEKVLFMKLVKSVLDKAFIN